MSRDRGSRPSWNVKEALAVLRAQADPYIWEQGQELFQRGAVEDFQLSADGRLQVQVLDPRDLRKFFVVIQRDSDGRVTARCPCPYRLNGCCRHQVVALEYLRSVSEAGPAAAPAASAVPSSTPAAPEAGSEAAAPAPPSGPVLYRLNGPPTRISTRADGSLLRVVLHSLGTSKTPYRIGLQLFTGTGWTDMRTPDLGRWIGRGDAGPHPRDAALAARLAAEGSVRREVDAELFASLLVLLQGSEALVTRGGEPLLVSPWPYRLAARVGAGSGGGLAVDLRCLPLEGEARPWAEVLLVPSVSPWIQIESGAFHPLVAGAAGPLLAELEPEELAGLNGADLDLFLSRGLGELDRLCLGGVETEPGLIAEVEGVTGARIRLSGTTVRLSGGLELCYGGEWMDAPATPEPWTVSRDGEIRRYPPAGQALSRADRELTGIGFRREDGRWTIEGPEALGRVLRPRQRAFVNLIPPQALEASNLVERAPVLRLEVREMGGAAGPAGSGAAARRGSGLAWLEVTYQLSDGSRSLPVDIEALASAAQRDPAGVLQLDDGTVLGLGHPSVRSLLALAGESRVKDEGRLQLPLSTLGELAAPSAGREVEFQGRPRELLEALAGRRAVEAAELDASVAGILRPYQQEAVQWMGALASLGLSGLLADEMGLGKTVMLLAHLFGRTAGGAVNRAPVLVVCPSSLIFNWIAECRRFFPSVEAVGLYGQSPQAREEAIKKGAELLVTSYALLRRDREALEARELRAVVLDEGQHIKNADSQTAQAAFALLAPERWILTGTPVENHLGELWSLFHFLLPGFLGERAQFAQDFADPIRREDADAARRLRARVRPFLLRRTKAQVLPDLPPRIDQVERVPMTAFQESLYRLYLERARGEVEDVDGKQARFQLLAALTRLRQIACHPRLVLGETERGAGEAEAPAGAGAAIEAAETGGKFELCLELLEECREDGHRVLLYSQFTSLLDLLQARIEEAGMSWCRLDGSTRDREGVVRRFTGDSSITVFLISLKAGGFGLNLTQADTVILYDPWWNPAAEEQAAARAHRLGQSLPVHVHKLITAGTVEEKILELQERKRGLAGAIVSEEQFLGGLSLDELRSVLFE